MLLGYRHDGQRPGRGRGDAVTEPMPGDLCRLLGDYQVEHYRCDQYPDGTITSVATGAILRWPV